ncbi:hypothetical protein GQX73_g3735 [Xylaria multiplex]|uniref:Uncharacterized protein n=1 Tax=Xylaria multiplex TaxID=323545 RepID=A0A7C8IQK3_9PEZI|nr:hypothetical protein GQX73_g3735 [Xylaria multiplex]
MSSFFSIPGAQKKRKRDNDGAVGKRPARPRPTTKSQVAPKKRVERVDDDDEISSGSDSGSQPAEDDDAFESESDESDNDETAAQKRLRLASEYLSRVREEVEATGWDAEQIDKDMIAARLEDDVAESKGKVFRHIASDIDLDSRPTMFRDNTHTNCDALAFVESLFGHADSALDVDALALERLVSVGARDRTVRRELYFTTCLFTWVGYGSFWKVADETQLVFRATSGTGDKKKQIDLGVDPNSLAATGSLDRVAYIDESYFITGWTLSKKKPLDTIIRAHGLEDPLHPTVASSEEHPSDKVVPPPQPRGITSLRALPYSDLILSGSTDGLIGMYKISHTTQSPSFASRVWKFDEKEKKLASVGILGQPSQEITANGLVHQISTDAMDISNEDEEHTDGASKTEAEPYRIKGIVNDIAIISRGKGDNETFSVVCAVGKEHRLGRWGSNIKGAKNGAVVFELRRKPKKGGAKSVVNGVEKVSGAK